MKTKASKILLVEDEPSVRNGVKEWLTDDGYCVESVETGEQALEKIKKEAYGVIVLDLKLPDIDGLQVFEQVKKITPGIKGIIITAFPSKETHEKGKSLGIFDYLPKPFNVNALIKIISSALGELERENIPNKNRLYEIGALSYRLCDLNYECGSCPLAQDLASTFGTFTLIQDQEVAKLKLQPDEQKFCRFGSTYVTHKKNQFLG